MDASRKRLARQAWEVAVYGALALGVGLSLRMIAREMGKEEEEENKRRSLVVGQQKSSSSKPA